jgi:hypothetical protein
LVSPDLFPGYLDGSLSMAQIAASIEYEAAPPPDGLPDDMQPLPGASIQFLSIKAIDGFKVQAALWQPENRAPVDTTMIIQVHGSGGNLASLPVRAIARAIGQGLRGPQHQHAAARRAGEHRQFLRRASRH